VKTSFDASDESLGAPTESLEHLKTSISGFETRLDHGERLLERYNAPIDEPDASFVDSDGVPDVVETSLDGRKTSRHVCETSPRDAKRPHGFLEASVRKPKRSPRLTVDLSAPAAGSHVHAKTSRHLSRGSLDARGTWRVRPTGTPTEPNGASLYQKVRWPARSTRVTPGTRHHTNNFPAA
jgi:hypothetical protein